MKAAVVCLLLVALIAAPRAADKWTFGSSAHFEVYTTGGEAKARDALLRFERVHAFFTEFLKLSPRPTKPTRLIVFSGKKQYEPYRPSETAFAYYLPGLDADYIVMQELHLDVYPAVAHEYAHLVIRYSQARYPLWLDEGLAEFFSTMEPDGNRMGIGGLPAGRMQTLAGAVLMPLERVFGVTHDSPEYNTNGHAGVFYAQSWALTHMLMTTDRYRGKVDEFLRLMGNGVPTAEVLATVYGKTPQAIDAELLSYVRGNQQSMFLVNYKSPPQTKPPTRAADAFEGGLITAKLLANFREKEREARAAFEELAAQKPDDLSLIETRASFEFRRGHEPEALPYFARAVALGSKTPSLYREYASADPARATDLLGRAAALAPDDLDSQIAYASILLSERRAAEAVSRLSRFKEVPPDRAFRVFRILANAYAQANQFDDAKAAAARAAQFARPGTEADQAARLITELEDFDARRQASARPTAASAPTAAAPAAPGAGANPAQPASAPASIADRMQPADGTVIVMGGRLKNVICGTDAPVIEIVTDAQTPIRLLVDDPNAIVVLAAPGTSTVSLTCGAHDEPLRVGFTPKDNPARDTIGVVRRLDYR